jgi:hypothetical protein
MSEAKIKGSTYSREHSLTTLTNHWQCDGKRPACSACVLKERSCEYSTRVGVSSQAARRERLESYATILGLIRNAAPEDRDRILQDLRAPKSLNEAINIVQRNWVCKSGD